MRASTRPRNFRPILEFSRSQYLQLSSFCAPNFSKFSIPTIRNLLNCREEVSKKSFHRYILHSSSIRLVNFRRYYFFEAKKYIYILLNASKNIDFKGNTLSRIKRMKSKDGGRNRGKIVAGARRKRNTCPVVGRSFLLRRAAGRPNLPVDLSRFLRRVRRHRHPPAHVNSTLKFY